ncbi:MAG: N-acetylmuramoyl-L-alanine amidase [Oceanospirillales bacterium]|nr:MAG: N-acetylmuramoyl-L-alanine amidase [Oceanospirillales bacterium]
MKIKNHLLYHDNNDRVEWQETPNKSGHLKEQKPRYIIMHYTGGSNVQSAINTFKNRQAQASAHLIIGNDGRIVQMGRFHERCWHAGRSEWQGVRGLNSYSVGIELVNWGWLNGGQGNWRSWAGTRVPDENVVQLKHKHDATQRGWESFSETQIEVTLNVVRALLHQYDLTPDCIIGHDDISPGRKQDPGPAFPFDRFRGLLEGRRETEQPDIPNPIIFEPKFRVTASSGLNMRSGPSIADTVIKTLPSNSQVILLEKLDHWWLVSEVVNNKAETTGWVYSHWLFPLN